MLQLKTKTAIAQNRCYLPLWVHLSKKPDHFYETIERVTTGNRIELFARQKREGWDIWGNELQNDVELETSANNGR